MPRGFATPGARQKDALFDFLLLIGIMRACATDEDDCDLLLREVDDLSSGFVTTNHFLELSGSGLNNLPRRQRV